MRRALSILTVRYWLVLTEWKLRMARKLILKGQNEISSEEITEKRRLALQDSVGTLKAFVHHGEKDVIAWRMWLGNQ